MIASEDEPRMNTQKHEVGWAFFNDENDQDASATLFPRCDDFSR